MDQEPQAARWSTVGKLFALAALAVLARLAMPWPVGAVWGLLLALVLVVCAAPVWIAAAIRAGVGPMLHAAIVVWLFAATVVTLDALPDKSDLGVTGHVASLFCSITAIVWISGGKVDDFGLGLNLRDRATVRAIVVVVVVLGMLALAALALIYGDMIPHGTLRPLRAPLLETVIFQFVIVALDEEIAWRGFVQSWVDRSLSGSVQLAGARLGWGALVSGLMFALWHMIHLRLDPFQITFDPQPYRVGAFVYVYLRAYTRSVWPCVLFHGLWDGLGSLLRHVGS